MDAAIEPRLGALVALRLRKRPTARASALCHRSRRLFSPPSEGPSETPERLAIAKEMVGGHSFGL